MLADGSELKHYLIMNNGELLADYTIPLQQVTFPASGSVRREHRLDRGRRFMYGGTYNGPNAFLRMYYASRHEWEGLQPFRRRLLTAATEMCCIWNVFGQIFEDRKSVSVPFAHEWELRDGKL